VNVDRFWLGFLAGLITVVLLSKFFLWLDMHLIFVR